MPRAIARRLDFAAAELRGVARRSKGAAQALRLLALAAIYDGGTRSEAALISNVTLQIVRDWVVRFNGEGPDGLCDRKAPGATPLLTDAHRRCQAGNPLITLLEFLKPTLESKLGTYGVAAARRCRSCQASIN